MGDTGNSSALAVRLCVAAGGVRDLLLEVLESAGLNTLRSRGARCPSNRSRRGALVGGGTEPRLVQVFLRLRARRDASDLRLAQFAEPKITIGPGRFLGYVEGELRLEEVHVILEEGDTVIAYTDGFTEAHAPDGQTMFGTERLRTVLASSIDLSLEACVDGAGDAVAAFTGSRDLQDDQTLLLLRRVPASSKVDSPAPHA